MCVYVSSWGRLVCRYYLAESLPYSYETQPAAADTAIQAGCKTAVLVQSVSDDVL